MAQPGSAAVLGTAGRWFESSRPDHRFLRFRDSRTFNEPAVSWSGPHPPEPPTWTEAYPDRRLQAGDDAGGTVPATGWNQRPRPLRCCPGAGPGADRLPLSAGRARDEPRFPAFFDALRRLRQPSGEVWPAGAFLPPVEAGPIGRAIDRLALADALAALRANPAIRLAINMSPLSMGDAEWLAILDEATRLDRGACGRLILEITEAAAMRDPGQTVDFMDHVRRSGCAFALDDFGAGATSFRYFRDFRFDMIKIDGSFAGDRRRPRRPGARRVPDGGGEALRDGDGRRARRDRADADWLRGSGSTASGLALWPPVGATSRCRTRAARAPGSPGDEGVSRGFRAVRSGPVDVGERSPPGGRGG